jgi:hypothetical protein
MSFRFGRALRGVAVLFALPAAVAATAAPAGACGGLVGENGTIQLEKTSTLAAYHDGVERYVTSFEFSGTGEEVGSITPLPGIPTDVKRGGDWTLQRLKREVAPPPETRKGLFAASADQASGAEVLLETEVDALDITILKGGGSEVGKWAVDHGFFLTPDAPEMLDFYSRRSPIFMAARFDAQRAAALGQNAGDGTPIMLTIPTEEPWVPLRILSLGLDKSDVVEADVFLLTDTQPKLLAGGPGLSLDRNEQASSDLLADLRSDKGMEWVPESMWFTYLSLDAVAADLDYDLAMATQPGSVPSIADTGVSATEARTITPPNDWDIMPLVAAGLVGIGVFAIFTIGGRRRRPDVGVAA